MGTGGCDGEGEKEGVSEAESSPTSIVLAGEGKEGMGKGEETEREKEGGREIRRLSEAKQRPINGTKQYFIFRQIEIDPPAVNLTKLFFSHN